MMFMKSPALADGKLIVVAKNGRGLFMIDAAGGAYKQLAAAESKVADCTSPIIAGGKLYLRQWNNVACYDLRPAKP